jgi:hypothetical protein
MRTRKLIVACMVTTVVVACSKPTDEVPPVEDLSLALFASTASGNTVAPVASPTELERPDAPRATSSQAKRATVAAVPVALERMPELKAAIATMDEPALLGTAVEPIEIVGPVAVATAPAHDHAGEEGADEGRGPGIIIRGGVSGRDPCRIHGTGGGAAPGDVAIGTGVLINDRTPPGVGRNNPAFNTGRSNSGPQRGSRFPGGIR